MTSPLRSLWDVLQFYADKFVAMNGYFQQMAIAYLNPAPINTSGPAPSPLADSNLILLREKVERSIELSIEAGLDGTVAVLRRLLTSIGDPSDKKRFMISNYADQISHLLSEVGLRLKEELENKYCLILEREGADLLRNSEPLFGKLVASQFPSIIDEHDEARKCLAFERGTASAFHLIRSLEAGILAISRCLNIPDPIKAADRNWGAMLRVIKGGIDKHWPTSTDRLSGDGQFFDELYAAFAAMQNPYRNATMHLDQKYTLDEARNLMLILNGIMKKIAARMDENGLPHA